MTRNGGLKPELQDGKVVAYFLWGEAPDEPSSLRFDALKLAREDARPTEKAN